MIEYVTIDQAAELDAFVLRQPNCHFMQTSVYANAVYNQNDSKKIQLKQTLNLGVYFRF